MVVNSSIDGSGSQFIYPLESNESLLPQNVLNEYKHYKNIDDDNTTTNDIDESIESEIEITEEDNKKEKKNKEKELEKQNMKKETKKKRKMNYFDDDDDDYVDSEYEDY